MLNYSTSETARAFFASTKYVKVVMGPIGSGKSTMALFDLLLERALKQEPFDGVRRTRLGILRNTRDQLRATVKPLIDTWFVTLSQSRMGRWRVTDNTFEVRMNLPDGTQVHSDFILLAADTPDDVRRLLSLELSAAWVE